MAAEGRSGFALLAAVAIIAILAVLATIMTLTFSGDNDQARIEAVADELHRIASELDTTRTAQTPSSASFLLNMGKYPATISQLTHRPSSVDKNCSGAVWPGATPGAPWLGPYHTVPISPNGHNLAAGFFADNALVFTPSGATATDMAIRIPNVSLDDARRLDVYVDGTFTPSTLRVTYTPTNSSPVVLSYHTAIASC